MNFDFEDHTLLGCQEEFNSLDPEKRLYMTHYQLAEETDIKDSALWKRFLMDTRVSQWIDQELTIIKGTVMRKMIGNATSNDRSIGAAQMLNAISKTMENDTTLKDGPVFIYSYVPLNDKEQGIPNVNQLSQDVFERSE